MSGSIVGGYFAVTMLPGMLAARRLDRRLRDVSSGSGPPTRRDATTRFCSTQLEGPLPGSIDWSPAPALGNRRRRLIEQSGVRTTPSALALISLVVAAAAVGCHVLFVPQPFAPLAAACLGAFAPVALLMHRRTVRMKKFEEQFPEALDLMSRAIRAGHAFQTALGMAADELPEPVGPEFKKTFDQQNFGLPLRDALNEMSARVADPRRALLRHRRADPARHRRQPVGDPREPRARRARALQDPAPGARAHGARPLHRLRAAGAAGGARVALSFINPEHMQSLFRERMGQMMLMGAIVMQTIGFIWIRQVIKIEV